MDTARRTALKTLVAASLAPLAGAALAAPVRAEADASDITSINVMLPRHGGLQLEGSQGRVVQAQLTRAVMDFVRDNYKGGNLPVWHREYGTMDLEKRVANICHWIIVSCREHAQVYPLDPAWVAAQIMTESFFYEFAVSRALAVGICQFIGPTAEGFGLTVAGSSPAHGRPPHKHPADAGAVDDYYTLRTRWKKALRARRRVSGDETDYLKTALTAAAQGAPIPRADEFLAAAEKVDTLDAQVKDARERFIAYLRANFEGRSIFEESDVAFFKTFDERVLYKAPVSAMVLMLARFLRARRGNILAAAAGYHSGLGNTIENWGVYKHYGRIPPFSDTVSYVSRLLVNHHEIALRMA